jgi:hypothetical protein
MKTFIIFVLATQGLLFLGFAFYTVHTTGRTDGLADIANSTLMCIECTVLAVAAGFRKK